MHLYVWVSYESDGLAFAIAESLEQAAEWVMGSDGPINMDGWGPVQIFELDEPLAFSRRICFN